MGREESDHFSMPNGVRGHTAVADDSILSGSFLVSYRSSFLD